VSWCACRAVEFCSVFAVAEGNSFSAGSPVEGQVSAGHANGGRAESKPLKKRRSFVRPTRSARPARRGILHNRSQVAIVNICGAVEKWTLLQRAATVPGPSGENMGSSSQLFQKTTFSVLFRFDPAFS
jgi:hypothetical protein